MLRHILKMLDYSKTCYVELFGGSAKVLLNKQPHRVEIYNDYDYELYNLFKVVSSEEAFWEFRRALDNFLFMEATYKDWLNYKPKNDVERALRTYILLNSSFAGDINGGRAISFTRNSASSFWSKVDNLPLIKERLKRVTILNKDYRELLERLKDRTDIMLYADPPYYGTEGYYSANFTKEDHYILADYLNKAKYSVLLSYYEFPDIYKLYPQDRWRYYRFEQVKRSYGLTKFSKKKDQEVKSC